MDFQSVNNVNTQHLSVIYSALYLRFREASAYNVRRFPPVSNCVAMFNHFVDPSSVTRNGNDWGRYAKQAPNSL